MNILSLGATWLNNILNTIWLSICSVLYKFINWLYQVFESVARVNLFSEEVFKEITSRIYIVMGIAMLFIFAYNLVLMIVNPDDKKSTGATTKIVKETIISLVVVILLPTIFNYMYIFQNRILSTNIIGQIIMGGFGSVNSENCDPEDYECNCDFSDFDELKNYGPGEDKSIFSDGFTEGSTDVYQSLIDECNHYKNDLTDSQKGAYSIAPTVFSAFYRPAGYDMNECEEFLRTGNSTSIDDDKKKQICVNFFYDIEMSKYTGNIDGFVNDSYLKLTMSTEEGLIDFDWLFAIVAGGMAVWMFLCYAMEIGVRVAKLGVLQIISPITVMMRIVPGQKEKIYTKWFNQLMNTYLDVFIRLMIIYFSLFAVSLVPDVIDTLFASFYSGQSNWFIETLALVIVILGILKFAQEAPDLIKDYFGSSGNFAVKSPKKQLQDNKLAMGGLGMAGGLGKTAVGNTVRSYRQNRKDGKGKIMSGLSGIRHGIGGAFAGGYRGFKEGYKTNDLANLSGAISRAKADSDKKYYARDKRVKDRKNFMEKHGGSFADEHWDYKYGRGTAAAIGTIINPDAYKDIGKNKIAANFKDSINNLAGSSATNDARRNANSEVKGYAATALEAIDSQTKGRIKSYEEQREERIRQGNPGDIPSIREEYSKIIEKDRSETIRQMDASALNNLQKSIENLCDSIKTNHSYLENITGPNGALAKSIEKVATDMTPEFKQIFEGSLENFGTGMQEYLNNSDKFNSLNSSDLTAMVGAIDKISKTADNNLKGIANEKKTDKK